MLAKAAFVLPQSPEDVDLRIDLSRAVARSSNSWTIGFWARITRVCRFKANSILVFKFSGTRSRIWDAESLETMLLPFVNPIGWLILGSWKLICTSCCLSGRDRGTWRLTTVAQKIPFHQTDANLTEREQYCSCSCSLSPSGLPLISCFAADGFAVTV